MIKTNHFLQRRYTKMVTPDTDGGFVAEVLEFSGCYGYGATEAKALKNLNRAAQDWIEARLDEGLPIPEPFDEFEMSGKFALRLPKSLHSKAALYADREGVSLNTFIVDALSGSVGMLDFVDRYAKPKMDLYLVSQINLAIFQVKGTSNDIWPGLLEELPKNTAGTTLDLTPKMLTK